MHVLTPILLAGLLAVAHGHFTLNYPQTRGFDEDKEPLFCGGFPVNNNRQPFPLSGGFISYTSTHPSGDLTVRISLDSNPANFESFNVTSDGTTIPPLTPFTVVSAAGDVCVPVNITQSNIPGAKDGSNATIFVQLDGPDGKLMQCSDVVLSADAKVSSGTKCDNSTGTFPTNGGGTGLVASTVLFVGTSLLVILSLAI